jgi:hypothetical protein
MSTSKNSFKLILAGNRNVSAMINAIIRATIQVREDVEDEKLIFRQVHVFHTEQSLHSLMTSDEGWRQALDYYGIPVTSLVHHVAKIEDSNVDRFRDLVEQLRTIVNPLDNDLYYVDLTGGISALKTILAVFAYVLDIEHVYSLEIKFSNDYETRRKQTRLFYHELEQEDVETEYRRFPPIREFDAFGRVNYTEVLRHRQIIDDLTQSLAILLPSSLDLEHLRASLLSGMNSRLIGEVTGDPYSYRHSVFSLSAGVEEIANIILGVIKNADIENKTLGQKLGEIRDLFSNNAKYFISIETLEHLTRLIAEIRNNVVHPSPELDRGRDMAAIQSHLTSQLVLTFLQFTIKTLTAFLDQEGKLLEVQVLEPPEETDKIVFYFGFDGDATGDYLEIAFVGPSQGEAEVLRRSRAVREAIRAMKKLICRETKNHDSILFAEGDNILFKAQYRTSLLNELQRLYQEKTGLCSSIGYGRTLKEATIALRLAKAKTGNSIVGVALQ